MSKDFRHRLYCSFYCDSVSQLLWTDLPTDSLLILRILPLRIRIFQWQFFRIFYHSDFFWPCVFFVCCPSCVSIIQLFYPRSRLSKRKVEKSNINLSDALEEIRLISETLFKNFDGCATVEIWKEFFSSKNNIHTIYLFGTKIALTYI